MLNPLPPDHQVDATSQSQSRHTDTLLGSSSKSVAVLMCTYNGQRFLAEQLTSIGRQTHDNWTVVISDDGSTDKTLEVIESFANRLDQIGKVSVVQGPKRGFAANFLTLACRKEIQADFYAWSDQDDIWQENKIETALDWIKTIPSQVPALYCGRTRGMDSQGTPLECSPLFSRPPAFANALVQSLAGGNTMVFNQAARELFISAGEQLDIVSHDWWAYLLVTGAGGQVFYDAQPFVLYRQHEDNLVGSNSGFTARLSRLRMMLKGRFSNWTEQNINCLGSARHLLTVENQQILERFRLARQSPLPRRLVGLLRAGVYRQTLPGNIGLFLAAIVRGI
ncbi:MULTISPECIES: glycosyltransferase family 2 protein [unclassified Pseudomonas]|uniref:glycosyltransferase family 2 protein n=1 Tax=unclassified Pseudomonas TaxID=196821 RepID=UPI0021139318|nr:MULTISPECIES: glycosyltransferase family 2 protein [unclassified Pseudomonas]MCX4219522.1 glycosyltransferase family 2 protein [Pseudomonas sp. MCal1]